MLLKLNFNEIRSSLDKPSSSISIELLLMSVFAVSNVIWLSLTSASSDIKSSLILLVWSVNFSILTLFL